MNATGVSRRTTRDGSEDGQDAQRSRVQWGLKVVLPSESKHMEFNNFMATNLVSMTPNSFVEGGSVSALFEGSEDFEQSMSRQDRVAVVAPGSVSAE